MSDDLLDCTVAYVYLAVCVALVVMAGIVATAVVCLGATP